MYDVSCQVLKVFFGLSSYISLESSFKWYVLHTVLLVLSIGRQILVRIRLISRKVSETQQLVIYAESKDEQRTIWKNVFDAAAKKS